MTHPECDNCHGTGEYRVIGTIVPCFKCFPPADYPHMNAINLDEPFAHDTDDDSPTAEGSIRLIADLMNELDEKEEQDELTNDEEHDALNTIRWILEALGRSGYTGVIEPDDTP